MRHVKKSLYFNLYSYSLFFIKKPSISKGYILLQSYLLKSVGMLLDYERYFLYSSTIIHILAFEAFFNYLIKSNVRE